MNAARDSCVEDNFDNILDTFMDCGWEAALDNGIYKSYASKSEVTDA